MKERPILFKGAMVRAILDGRKTQTRRVIKEPPTGRENFPPSEYRGDAWFFRDAYYADINNDIGRHVKCPYGRPGDHLWVRETWGIGPSSDPNFIPSVLKNRRADFVLYRADGGLFHSEQKWRPSIHMPRWASRIELDITNVRVERLQDMTEKDARLEGCHPTIENGFLLPIRQFPVLWDAINAKRGFGWHTNPWVWVIEFKRLGL